MYVIEARNPQQALPKAMRVLAQHGVTRSSRNGTVRVAPWPVTTVYARPIERVVFWPARDANPAFHLYEALWMLRGRHDVAPLQRYVKDFDRFSDDGETLHGAYGWRWRYAMDEDQLETIATRLQRDPDDRRCVLQMWDGNYDLGVSSRDIPCNLIATFQVAATGALDLTVFCRSNDVLLGCYGANAVHFSLLLEYMAAWIGRPVGIYRQVSVNWHAYEGPLYDRLRSMSPVAFSQPDAPDDPYTDGRVLALPVVHPLPGESPTDTARRLDTMMDELLLAADTGFGVHPVAPAHDEPWWSTAWAVLRAHELWRVLPAPARYTQALAALAQADPQADWGVSMGQWLGRRYAAWKDKQCVVPA